VTECKGEGLVNESGYRMKLDVNGTEIPPNRAGVLWR